MTQRWDKAETVVDSFDTVVANTSSRFCSQQKIREHKIVKHAATVSQ